MLVSLVPRVLTQLGWVNWFPEDLLGARAMYQYEIVEYEFR